MKANHVCLAGLLPTFPFGIHGGVPVVSLGGPGNCGSPDEGPDASQQTLLATDEEGGHANEVAHGRLGSREAFGLHLRGELRGQGFAYARHWAEGDRKLDGCQQGAGRHPCRVHLHRMQSCRDGFGLPERGAPQDAGRGASS